VPLDKEMVRAFTTEHPDENIVHVWQIKDNQLKELLVLVGINNGIYYQIKDGLKGDEELLLNVLDVVELKKVLSQESSS
jgi:hypothetical protein